MTRLPASITLGFAVYLGLSPSAGLASPRYFDFNGDGHGDLAVGAPGQNSRAPGGMVFVYRGFATAGGYDPSNLTTAVGLGGRTARTIQQPSAAASAARRNGAEDRNGWAEPRRAARGTIS